MKEDDLINRYFKRKTRERADVFLGIGDDAALLRPPENMLIAISTDSLVENIHFTSSISPRDLGYRALAVNLSDLAAMGALPAWTMLSLVLPKIDPDWLENFSDGFLELANEYSLQLVGGNISAGPLSITVQIMGFIPEKVGGIKRSGAKPGDHIYVTGTLGDAGLALYLIKHQQSVSNYLLTRFHHPTPRIEEGLFLRSKANAMIDISDGLAKDLANILEQSNVGGTLWVEQLPLSLDMKSTIKNLSKPLNFAYELALFSGDDYELCFTAPKDLGPFPNSTCIGMIESSRGLKLTYKNQPFVSEKQGYEHFD